MARIKYELLDKKHNENRTEQSKTETLDALDKAKSIAKTRQAKFVTELTSLFDSNKFNDCENSTAFYNKLDSEDSLKIYKDLFNECEHWASHHQECSDGLKEFLEAVAKNKKQTTNYLLTKDRTCAEKAKDVANFYKSIATLGGIFVGLKALNLEQNLEHHFAEWGREAATHFAEWGREAATAVYNTSAGHSIVHNATHLASAVANSAQANTTHLASAVANSAQANATHLASAVANSSQAHAVTTGVNAVANSAKAHATHIVSAVANSAPAHAVTTGVNAVSSQAHAVTTGVNAVPHSPLVIGATKVVVGLVGFIKSIPILPVVAAGVASGVAGFLATGVYLNGMDYPEPENIQDIINKQGAADPESSITNVEGRPVLTDKEVIV